MKIDGDPQVQVGRPPGPMAALLAAVHFAADQHRDQRRKGSDASPYVNHAIAVAELLATVARVEDPEILQAAVLHDVLEDTEVLYSELEARFGPAVASMVAEVSDDKSLPSPERKERQAHSARDLSLGAKLIRIADKICNVHDVGKRPPSGWTPMRRQAYVAWTGRVVDGCRGVSPALEARFDEVRAEALSAISRDA
jgi:guanosine-3',5'-bis(diphosphate) 3'-pyrophosphohydrolase